MSELRQLLYLVTLRPSVRARSASSLVVGTGAKVFVLTEDIWFAVPSDLAPDRTAAAWRPVYPKIGETVTADDGAGNTMTGTITGYVQATRSLTVQVTSIAGSGTIASWTITGLVTLRYASGPGFVSEPDDAPASTIWEPCVQIPPAMSRHLFSRGSTFGASELTLGTLSLRNTDGHLDHLHRGYSFALREAVIVFGLDGGALSTFRPYLTGVTSEAAFGWSDLTLRLQDPDAAGTLPLQVDKYTGTNAPVTPPAAVKAPGTLASDAAVGTTAWSNPANAAAQDAVFASAATPGGGTSQYLKLTGFTWSPAIPVGSTIRSVLVSVERKATAGIVTDNSVRLVVGGVPAGTAIGGGAPWPSTEASVLYGSASYPPGDLWGLALTRAQVIAADFGVAISAALDPGAAGAIDRVGIGIFYTGPSSGVAQAYASVAANDASIGSIAWTSPSNAAGAANDNVYATVLSPALATQYLKATNFGFNVADVVPPTAVIVGVEVAVRRMAAGGTIKDAHVRLVVGGVVLGAEKANAAAWASVEEALVYGGPADSWSAELTATLVRASDFGVVISASGLAGEDSTAYIDSVAISIYFDAGAVVMGIEGGPEIQGILKPLCLAAAENAAPDLVNPGLLIYRLGTGLAAERRHTLFAVRDSGVPVTQPNRVPTPDLSSSTGWTLGTGWTISGGKLKHAAGSHSDAYCTLTGALAAAAPHILGFHQLVRSGPGLQSVRLQTNLAAIVWQLDLANTEEGFIDAYIAAGLDPSVTATNNWLLVFEAYASSDLDIDLVNYTPVPDRATAALLQAGTPTAGGFDTCNAEGLFKLGSRPAGQVTADFALGPYSTPASFSGVSWRVGEAVERILAGPMGLSAGQYSAADIAALKARYATDAAIAAIFLPATRQSPSINQALDGILQPLLYWRISDRDGVMRIKALDDELAGVAAFTLRESEIADLLYLVPNDPGTGAPAKTITVGYHPNSMIQQDASLAGDKTSANDSVGGLVVRGYYAVPVRTVLWETLRASIEAHEKGAYELSAAIVLVGRTSAELARDRLAALRGVRREMLQVTLLLDPATFAAYLPGARCSIESTRFGLDAGKVFLVIGEDVDAANFRHTLYLWG